jgi:serine/threonine protein kinase
VSKLTATLMDGRRVDYLPDAIGEGGMKRVYFTADKKSVLCFFKDQDQKDNANRMERLKAILGNFNPTTDPTHGAHFRELFCWPTGIVTSPQFGIMTPSYSSNFFFGTGPWQGKEKEGKWFSSPKLRRMLPPVERGTWVDYLRLCQMMARAVRKLHMTGLAHSDLSSKNVLIDPPNGTCAVIDIDSLVVPDKYPPDVLGTPGYIAPEVLATQNLAMNDPKRKLPSNLTDLHALAVLIYEYLLRRHPLRGPKVNGKTTEEDEFMSMGPKALYIENPKDQSNSIPNLAVLCDQLGPHLPRLFQRAFVDGLHNPGARPGAAEWEKELGRSNDLLIPCGNSSCDEKWFLYNEKETPRCPWCKWQLKDPLPVFDFHFVPAGRRGSYRREGHSVVGYDKKCIYTWHVFHNVRAVEGVDATPQAQILRHQGRWIMHNQRMTGLISPQGNPVPNGHACVLNDGDELLLSGDEHGRLITVKMIP